MKLEKKYGLPMAIAMVIGIVIGSGVFFKAQTILQKTDGNMPLGIIAWIIGGLIMIICAYCLAVLGTRYDKINGLVDYAEATLGEKYAYIVGWFMTMIYTPCLTSVLAWLSARYTLAVFLPDTAESFTSGRCLCLACLYLVADYALNALAPVIAGKVQVSTTVIKLIPLGLMAVVGTIYGLVVTPAGASAPLLIENFNTANGNWTELFGAVVATAFAYEGWIIATTINAELKDAKKNLPKALIIGTIIVMLVYIAYYVGVAGGATVDILINDGATQAFKNIFGNVGGSILNVFIAVSCLGTLNGLMVGCTRNLYSIAARKCGPKHEVFAQVDEKTNMPNNSAVIAVLLSALWLFYFFIANLDNLLVGTYSADTANAIIRTLGTLSEDGLTYTVGWFCFDSSELAIITLYALYIPIFIKMFSFKDLSVFKRVIMPTLAIISSVFMMFAAVYAHRWGVLYYLIIMAIIMAIGVAFMNNKKAE